MNLEEYKGVYIFAEQVDGKVSNIAYELIGEGKNLAEKLNTEVTAVLIGSGVKGEAEKLGAYGADRVILVDDPELKDYRTEPYTHALSEVINKFKPEIVLIGATAIGRDLGPSTLRPALRQTARSSRSATSRSPFRQARKTPRSTTSFS